MPPDRSQPPLNPLPWIVWALVLPIVAMEVTLAAGQAGLAGGPEAIGWRLDALQRFAFVPDLARQAMATGQGWGAVLARAFTYPVVHGGFTAALFAVVLTLALGKMVAEVFRPWAVLAVVFGSSVAGAFAYALVPGATAALAGASPAVYGLVGAFTWVLWVRLAGTGSRQYQAFALIGVLLAVQLLFGVLFGTGWDWVADVAGFAAGFALSFVVAPGGWRRLVARLRQR